MKIILVRHGEVIDKEDPHLTRLGRIQVTRLAKRLKKEKIDKIYSSDLKRTIQTAKIIGRERKQGIEFTPLIREISDETIEKHKNEWENKEFNNKRLNEIKEFLRRLEKKHKNETILLIAHAKTNRAIISILTGIKLYESYIFKQYHSCINVLKRENRTIGMKEERLIWRILLINSVEHLSNKLITSLNKKKRNI